MSDPRRKRLLIFGTSLSAERTPWPWRACGGAWATLIRERYGRKLEILNASGWGRDSLWASRSFERRVLRKDPAMLLMEFAINDADERRRISVDASADGLRRMLDALHAACPRTRAVVMTTNGVWGRHATHRPRLDHYYEAWRSVAREYDRALCDMKPAWDALARNDAASYKRFIPDGIHPGPDAAAFIADLVEPVLNRELQAA